MHHSSSNTAIVCRCSKPIWQQILPGCVLMVLGCAQLAWASDPASMTTTVSTASAVTAASTTLATEASQIVISDLASAFALAWARQPEAQSLELLLQAQENQDTADQSWLAAPPSLEAAAKSDQWSGNEGRREYLASLNLPLWLPQEQTQRQQLTAATRQAVHSRWQAARLRLAASLRTAWWDWQRAQAEIRLATDQLRQAQRLRDDVARRYKAGDLALADLYQAESASAQAEAALASRQLRQHETTMVLGSLLGLAPERWQTAMANVMQQAEALPSSTSKETAVDAAVQTSLSSHPDVQAWHDQQQVASAEAALAQVKTRSNPELVLTTSRERDALASGWGQSLTVGLRIPLGQDPRATAQARQAQAIAAEAEATARLAKARVQAEIDAARQRYQVLQDIGQTLARRAELAQETRGFFEKSFQLGASDLPTRLRVEQDAATAVREAELARLDEAAALSAWRQALGLLPQ